LVVAANQQVTREWWENHKERFSLFASPVVRREVMGGSGAPSRLQVLSEIPSLDFTDAAAALGIKLLEKRVIPAKAAEDAYHLAISSVHGIQVLLTWNCSHLANPFVWRQVERVFASEGFELPVICTPAALLEDEV
jgi:predicted nucleic acid-binding protein